MPWPRRGEAVVENELGFNDQPFLCHLRNILGPAVDWAGSKKALRLRMCLT
jgi:hypothetical protein